MRENQGVNRIEKDTDKDVTTESQVGSWDVEKWVEVLVYLSRGMTVGYRVME